MIHSVRSVRRILLVVAMLLVVIDGVAIALLLSPQGRSRTDRKQVRDQLQQELHAKMKELGPARNIDQNLAEARKQQEAFYRDRLASRYSDISDAIGKLASENHVQVSSVKYDAKSTDIKNLQQINISTQVVGDYTNQMRFINSLERAKLFFVIDSVNLGGGEGGSVRLDMKLETFLRSAT